MRNPLRRYWIGHPISILGLEARWRVNLRDSTEHKANGTPLLELFNFFIFLEKMRYLSMRSCFLPKRSYSIVRSDCEE